MTLKQQDQGPSDVGPDIGSSADGGLSDRVSAAMAKIGQAQPEPPVPDPTTIGEVSEGKPEGGDPPQAGAPVPTEKPGEVAEPERGKGGKFTVSEEALDRWIQENPEKLAKLFPDSEEAQKRSHVGLSKKRQRISRQLAEIAEVETRIKKIGEEQQTAIDEAISRAQPGIDILDALAKGDFVALDSAFLRAGVSFDDWTKKRLRVGAGKVSQSAEQARIAELEAKLKAGNEPPKKEEKAPEKPAATEEPTYTVETIAEEVDDTHPVRNIADWGEKIQKLTTEDEDLPIEDAADQVLAEARKALGLQEPETTQTPTQRRTRRKPKAAPEPEPEEFDAEYDPAARMAELRRKYGIG